MGAEGNERACGEHVARDIQLGAAVLLPVKHGYRYARAASHQPQPPVLPRPLARPSARPQVAPARVVAAEVGALFVRHDDASVREADRARHVAEDVFDRTIHDPDPHQRLAGQGKVGTSRGRALDHLLGAGGSGQEHCHNESRAPASRHRRASSASEPTRYATILGVSNSSVMVPISRLSRWA